MVAVTDWPGEDGLPADVVKGGIPISDPSESSLYRRRQIGCSSSRKDKNPLSALKRVEPQSGSFALL
jgi:hypothetical protein